MIDELRRFIEFEVAGEPVAQGRPRFTTNRGFVTAYDPKKSTDQKRMIGLIARETMKGQNQLEGALSLELKIYCHHPKSWSKKKIKELESGKIFYKDTKPDTDNYIKLVLDSLNGIVFHDDSAVVKINAVKYWSDKDLTYIKVMELHD